MNNGIQVFQNAQFGPIRTQLRDGQVWFVGKDVAVVLGYAKPRNAIAVHVDEEDKTTALIQGPGSNYKSKTTFISESGLYSLILASKLPQAREFKHWVTAEVLPQIRQTGGYIPFCEEDDEQTMMAHALLIAQRTVEYQREALKKANSELAVQDLLLERQRPKVEFADAVSISADTCTIAELAKIIYDQGVDIGQKRLFQWLRDNGYLGSNRHHWNMPQQKYIERGLFKVKSSNVWIDAQGKTHYAVTPVVTGMGVEYFVGIFNIKNFN